VANRILAMAAKNAREKIVIAETKYEGHDLIDVRVHYLDESDELKPTRKGIAMQRDSFPEFAEAIQEVSEKLEQGQPEG